MIFYCSYKWIILAFLLISFQNESKENITDKLMSVEQVKKCQKKIIFF